MEPKAFEEKEKRIRRLLDNHVMIGKSKESVMDYFCRIMETERETIYTGEQVARLNRILLRTIKRPGCESDREQEERKARWRREAEARSRFPK